VLCSVPVISPADPTVFKEGEISSEEAYQARDPVHPKKKTLIFNLLVTH